MTEDGCTVRDLVNRFLASKEQLVESGELSQRSFDDYHKECQKVTAFFGQHRMVEDLTPEDFEDLRAELAKRLGPVALGNAINRVRILFKYAYDQFLVDKPVRYGQGLGILLTFSELPELLTLCDRILVLSEGRLTGELPREEATEQRIMELATERPAVDP